MQRYLTSGQRVYKVSPQSYWWEHKFDYVYLLNIVRRVEEYRSLLAEHDSVNRNDDDDGDQVTPADVQKAEDFVSPALTFFESFSDIAGQLWNVIQEPFSKNAAALDDFLDEDEDNGDNGGDTRAAYRALAMEEGRNEEEDNQCLAEYYRQQMRGEDDDDKEQEEENDGEEEDARADTGALCDTSEDESDREHNSEDDSSEVVVMEQEESSSDDEFFRKQDELTGSIGRRKSETPRSRRENRLQESKTPRKRRIIAENDSEDENRSIGFPS